MKRTTNQNRRVQRGLVLLAALLVGLTGCKDKPVIDDDDDEEETAESFLDNVTDEDLASFDANYPLTEGGGHSDAFEIHPLDEVHISAPAGAFDENPSIHVSVASGEQFQNAEERLAEMMPNHEVLWAYDIDAGLPSDSVLPGKYTVKIDLNRLGIPEELQPGITLIRMDDKGRLQQINTRVKKGVIRYEACQNSVTVVVGSVALAVLIPVGIANGSLALPVRAKMKLEAWKDAGYPIGFWNKTDLMEVPVQDASGNFNVLFQFGKTERGDRFKDYVEKTKRLEKRLAKLKEVAQKRYDRDHPAKLFTWTEDAEAARKRRVGRDSLYYQMVRNDDTVQELVDDPDLELPQSVQDVIKATKLANQFSLDTLGLGMKPLSYTYNVYLVPSAEIGDARTAALFQPLIALGGKILVNYDCYLKGDGKKRTYNSTKITATGLTMAHEIGHAYENEYITSVLVSDLQFFEAIGSVTEHWYAAWLKKKGYVKIADTESAEAMTLFQYCLRDGKQMLAWPLGIAYPKKETIGLDDPKTFGGYMLGDLVQFLCDNKKKVTFDRIMTHYAYNKSFLQDMKDIFSVENDRDMAILYEKFCWKYMAEIVRMQDMWRGKKEGKGHLIPSVQLTPQLCVKRVTDLGHKGTTQAKPFAVKTVEIDTKTDRPYTLFAVPSEKVQVQTLKFAFLEGDSMQQAKDRLRLEPCKKDKVPSTCHAVIFPRPGIEEETMDREVYFDIIALYQPEHQPEVKGETKDGDGLLVELPDEPNSKLTQLKYLSGMQIAVVNQKTKQAKTFDVPLQLCGKEAKVPYEFLKSIGIDDPEDISVRVSSRWYYKDKDGNIYYSPATKRTVYTRKKDHEEHGGQPVTPEDEDDGFTGQNNEDVSEDLGDQAMGKQMLLKEIDIIGNSTWFYVGTLKYKDSHPVYANVVLKSGRFKITIPSHQYDDEMHVQGFTLEGKYKVTTKYYIVYDNGREKDRIPYKYIEFQSKDMKLLAPFSIKQVQIGSDNGGHRVEFTQTWTHTQLPGEWSNNGGGIGPSRQEDLDTGERVLHINLQGHSHSVRNHEPKEGEADVCISISGELK